MEAGIEALAGPSLATARESRSLLVDEPGRGPEEDRHVGHLREPRSSVDQLRFEDADRQPPGGPGQPHRTRFIPDAAGGWGPGEERAPRPEAIHREPRQRLTDAGDDEEGGGERSGAGEAQAEIGHEPGEEGGDDQVEEVQGAMGEAGEPTP